MTPTRPRPHHHDGLTTEILVGLDAARTIENQWRRLERVSKEPLSGFQTVDWCLSWMERYCTGAQALGEPRLLCVWQGPRLVGLWPAMVSRKALGARVLKPLGVPHTQYAAALIDPAADRRMLTGAFRAAFKALPGIDLIVADPVSEGSFLAEVFGSSAMAGPAGNEAGMLRLDGFDSLADYEATLSSSQRKGRRRRRKGLEKAGEVAFRVVWGDEPDHAALMRTCIAWKVRWLAETGLVSAGFSIPGYDAFLAGLPGSRDSLSGSVLFVLEIDGKPVAIEHGLIHQRHHYAYIGSFDWEHRELSAGKVLMAEIVEWGIAHGIKAYDLLGNPADYKSGWTNHAVPLSAFMKPVSLRGTFYGRYWLAMLKPRLKQAWLALPGRWRRQVTQTQGAAD